MISDLEIRQQQTLQISQDFSLPLVRHSLSFLDRPRIPWKVITVTGSIVNMAGIGIFGLVFRDENAVVILNAGFIPWFFAFTTETARISMTPEVPQTNFLATAIGGYVPGDFYVFPEWSVELSSNSIAVGTMNDAAITFQMGTSDD